MVESQHLTELPFNKAPNSCLQQQPVARSRPAALTNPSAADRPATESAGRWDPEPLASSWDSDSEAAPCAALKDLRLPAAAAALAAVDSQ